MSKIPIGEWFANFVDFLDQTFGAQFAAIRDGLNWAIDRFEFLFELLPFWAVAILLALLAWRIAGKGEAIFTLLGILFIANLGLWPAAIRTISLVVTATIIALLIGVPLGILGAKFRPANIVLRPILDLMQTMPAFVYLLPAVMLFRIGVVPAVFSTIIFAMPPAIRLTILGIQQVPEELVEAGHSFGSSWSQLLFKVELPQALPSIMAGINQSIMLALSMVVIASLIGAGGLGSVVITGVQGFNIGLGFEGGIAVVIIAIILDRLTQGRGSNKGYRNS